MRNRELGGWGTWSWPHSLMLVTTQPFRYSSVSSPLHANLHTSRHFSCWPVCAAARKSRPVRSRRARETAVHRREPYRLPQCVLLPLVFQDVPHLRELARQRGFLELRHQFIELLHAVRLVVGAQPPSVFLGLKKCTDSGLFEACAHAGFGGPCRDRQTHWARCCARRHCRWAESSLLRHSTRTRTLLRQCTRRARRKISRSKPPKT